jgi:hypothetical protein
MIALLLATAVSEAAEYELIMPLQYNRYQPLSAEILGAANGGALASGPVSLFDNPARLFAKEGISAVAGSSFISGNQSHVLIRTGQSLALPGSGAAVFQKGRYCLGFGLLEPMDMNMSYPDQWQPAWDYGVSLSVMQASLGAAYELNPGMKAGISLNYLWSDISWSKADTSVVQGRADGTSINAGIVIGISPEFSIFTRIRTEGKLQGFTEFKPDPGSSLELYGMVPALSSLGAVYQVDTGLTVAGQLDITGWQNVSWDYAGRPDLRLAALWQVVPGEYWLSLGFFTMRTPLDAYQISNYPDLHDMYFISAGQSFEIGQVKLSLAGATSRLFSRSGLNQDMLALSLEYLGK